MRIFRGVLISGKKDGTNEKREETRKNEGKLTDWEEILWHRAVGFDNSAGTEGPLTRVSTHAAISSWREGRSIDQQHNSGPSKSPQGRESLTVSNSKHRQVKARATDFLKLLFHIDSWYGLRHSPKLAFLAIFDDNNLKRVNIARSVENCPRRAGYLKSSSGNAVLNNGGVQEDDLRHVAKDRNGET
ncbi:hypothetical protein LAZ67_8003856 [Cordylochernes scorpioides]|uniref:Uncharacterized protein n=1 Tax=Cordylochernes scorpioides TaxID=51811 RepID=A0ABY6KRY2_9ARAC|nr:hypothetical protein LAZ67_8003856 [Cordylochernes scorpioides]